VVKLKVKAVFTDMAPETSLARLRRLEKRLRRRHVIATIPIIKLKDRENPLEALNSAAFKERFHMFIETAAFVIKLIGPNLIAPVRRGCQLPPALQVLTVIRFYCTNSFQLHVGDSYNTHQSTVSRLIKKVSVELAKLRPKFIKFPTHEEAEIVRSRFYEIAGFPGTV